MRAHPSHYPPLFSPPHSRPAQVHHSFRFGDGMNKKKAASSILPFLPRSTRFVCTYVCMCVCTVVVLHDGGLLLGPVSETFPTRSYPPPPLRLSPLPSTPRCAPTKPSGATSKKWQRLAVVTVSSRPYGGALATVTGLATTRQTRDLEPRAYEVRSTIRGHEV